VEQASLDLRPPRPERADARIRDAVARVIALRKGESQAITGEQLAVVVRDALGLEAMSLRSVQRRCEEAVEDLRAAGVLIAASGAGKFTPVTPEEIERDLRQTEAKARKQLRHRSRMRRALAEMRGQLRLAGGTT
jgi:hypothetical protein